jgi:hypothetical protein
MANPARRLDRQGVVQEIGTIRALDKDGWLVETDVGALRARRATSCLVEPAVGDLVLVAAQSSGKSYVLAVLEREAGAAATVAVEGDLTVRVGAGQFTVAAQEGVRLVSAAEVSVASAAVRVDTRDAGVAVERLHFLGSFVRAEVQKVKLVAESFDAVLDRWLLKVKRSYRTVEEFDQLRAARIDYVAEQEMNLHAKNALLTAEELVKVDGEQLHLG